MSAACDFCDDTGSLSKSLHGDLDCAECMAAQHRVELNAMVARSAEHGEALYWQIYLAGFKKGQRCQN